MKLRKLTTIALLASVITLPAIGMNESDIRSEKSVKSSKMPKKKNQFESLIEQIMHAENEQHLNQAIDEAMTFLHGIEDSLHDPLEAYRNKEHEDYADRAEHKGFDYTRLYQYQEGHNQHRPKTPHSAAVQHEMSDLHKKIGPVEGLLKDVHSLMSLLEQCREVGLQHLSDIKNENKKLRFDNLVAQLIEKNHQFSQNKDFMLVMEFNSEQEMAQRENPFERTICPDRQLQGKKVTGVFPAFSMEIWKQSDQSRDVRTGVPHKPLTQIRLQGKLWDVFAGKQGPTKTSTGQWKQGANPWDMVFEPNTKVMTFLPRSNLKSKICEYVFITPDNNPNRPHGMLPGHPHGAWGHIPMEATYSIVLKLAKNQTPEPRDRSDDAVQDQLTQEIEGEGLKVPNVTNAEKSRKAVHKEMDQRLARRDFDEHKERRLHRFANEERLHHHKNLGLPSKSAYLSPGDIKDQTYGRVHVPDYRYGRVYEHTAAIQRAQSATPHEIHKAKEDLLENEARETLEGESITSEEMGHYRMGRMTGQEGKK